MIPPPPLPTSQPLEDTSLFQLKLQNYELPQQSGAEGEKRRGKSLGHEAMGEGLLPKNQGTLVVVVVVSFFFFFFFFFFL